MSIVLDGSNLTTTGVINSATAQNSTSGTSIDFTGIPSGAKRITVILNEVSLSGTAALLLQLGDSGGIENTSYVSYVINGASGSSTNTTGFLLINDPGTAASTYSGLVTVCLVSGTTWIEAGTVSRSGGPYVNSGAGSKTLSPGPLDRIRITTTNGTDTFDLGSINILYE
jgi:hypothetical protein